MSEGGDSNDTTKDLLGDPIKDAQRRRRTSRSAADHALMREFLAANRAAATKAEASPSAHTQATSGPASRHTIAISLLAAVLSGTAIQALVRLVPGQNWLLNPDLLTVGACLISAVCVPRPTRLSIAAMIGMALLILLSFGWAVWVVRSPSIDIRLGMESVRPAEPSTTPPDPKRPPDVKRRECEQEKQSAVQQAVTNLAVAKRAISICQAKPRTLGQVLAITPRCKDEGEALVQAERDRWFAQRRDCSLPAN